MKTLGARSSQIGALHLVFVLALGGPHALRPGLRRPDSDCRSRADAADRHRPLVGSAWA
jgi:hypothetical protein